MMKITICCSPTLHCADFSSEGKSASNLQDRSASICCLNLKISFNPQITP